MQLHQQCLFDLVGNYLLSEVQSHFWNARSFSSKSDSNFWQSEVICHIGNPLLCTIRAHYPVLALHSWYTVFTGNIFTVSHALSLMKSHKTNIPSCLFIQNWITCSSASGKWLSFHPLNDFQVIFTFLKFLFVLFLLSDDCLTDTVLSHNFRDVCLSYTFNHHNL
jgi:hypothetical protein